MCGGGGNCGPCNPPNGVGQCIGNVCVLAGCNPGFDDCDGKVPNGCEVNVMTDAANCGLCGKRLPGRACQAGMCGGGGNNCNRVGFGDCDRNPGNGCETDLMSDPTNCGACGVPCANGQKCAQGVCR